jgi:hypothetical protein
MITELYGNNVKVGGSFRHQLAPITIFTGRMGSGKSARISALQLAVLGRHPDFPATPRGVFTLSAGREITAGVTVDGVSYDSTWKEGQGGKIEANVGALANKVPSIVVDPGQYFSLSPAQRVDYVFRSVSIGGGETSILDSMVEAVREGISATGQVGIESKRWVVSSVKAEADKAGSIQEGIIAAVDWVNATFTEENASVKRMSGMVAGMVQLSTDNGANLSAAKAEREKARSEYEAAKASYVAARTSFEHAGKVAVMLDAAKTKLATEYADFPDVDAALAHYRSIHEADTGLAKALDCLNSIERADTDAQGELSTLQEDIDNIEKATECPTCGAKKKGWKSRMLLALQGRQTHVNSTIEGLRSQAAVANKALAEAKAKDQERRGAAGRVSDLIEIRHTLAHVGTPATHTEVEINAMHAKVDAMRTDYEAKDKVVSEANRAAGAAAMAAKATGEKIAAETRLDCVKQAKKILTEWRGEIVANLFRSLLDRCNLFTAGGVLASPLAYNDGIGRYHQSTHRWIPLEAFSDGERAVALAAISSALGMGTDLRLAVVDGLGHMDAQSRAAFMFNVANMVQNGTLTQFIGSDFDGSIYNSLLPIVGNKLSLIPV